MPQALSEDRARRIGELRNVLYRSHPNRRDYSFTFRFNDPGWQVYINSSLDYGIRASDSVASHRLGLGDRPYVCWRPADSRQAGMISTFSEAQAVAALWADSTENYIATGDFKPAAGRPAVVDRSILSGYAPASPAESRPPQAVARSTSLPAQSLWAGLRAAIFSWEN